MGKGRHLPQTAEDVRGQADPQPPDAPTKKEEPVVKAGAGAGGAVGAATALMAATNTLGWTSFTPDDQLTIVAAVGIVAPVVAALVARMHVFAQPKG